MLSPSTRATAIIAKMAAKVNPSLCTAVLYQAAPVPAVGGTIKPLKPGGTYLPPHPPYHANVQGTPIAVPT
jgi:hypothetical protein